MSYIDVQLVNFRCWLNKTIRLQTGVNLISGKSGAGKSTLCKAIQFVIFGGRKHTDVENWNNIGTGTMVSLHFVSEQLQYKIVRTRPPECLKLYVMHGTQMMELDGAAAQAWINNIFGEEDKWIASSSISMKKPHFLIGASNSDKTSLLQHISLGDVSAKNQPDTYLTSIKTSISNYSGYLSKLDDEIRIQNSIRMNILNKNPNIGKFGNITKEDLEMTIKANEEEKIKLEKLRVLFSSIQSRRLIQKKISEIQLPPYTLEDLQREINKASNTKLLCDTYLRLNGFDKRVLTVDKKEIDNNIFLYSKFIDAGWNRNQDDLLIFIDEMNKLFELYKKQSELIEYNNKISEQNKKSIQLNAKMKTDYLNKLNLYNSYLQKIKEHDEKLKCLSYEIAALENKREKITESDDLSLSYLDKIALFIRLSKRKLELENELLDFDVEILDDKSNDLISKNSYLYSTYLNSGFSVKNDIKLYIELQHELHVKYQEQLNIISENTKIEESNKRKKQINDSERTSYQKKLALYEHEVQQLDSYNKSKAFLYDAFINSTKPVLESELDDYSSLYIKRKIDEMKMTLNELICPCCNHGLILKNSKLELGQLNCGDESKIREKIQCLESELKSRTTYEKKKYEYETYISTTKIPNPEKPNEPEYLQYDELKVVDPNVKKPSITIFEIPTISYIKLQKLLLSKNKIQLYKEHVDITKQLSNDFFINLTYNPELIRKYEEQYKLRNNLNLKYGDYKILSNIQYEKMEIPVEDTYFEIKELVEINETIIKPPLDIFDHPSLSYADTCSFNFSYPLISTYNKFVELSEELKHMKSILSYMTIEDVRIKISNVDEIKSTILKMNQVLSDCEKCRKYLNDCISNISCLNDSMKNLPEDDPEIENKIQETIDLIKYNECKIVVGQAIQEINNVTVTITECDNKRNEVVSYIGTLNELYTYIQELGNSIIDSKIGEINANVSTILDDLFDDEINVELSSIKTLKSGDTRLQINFAVDYKGHRMKGIEGFSDGEEERLSIALLMVFSRMNTSPILIIDEVLAGMNEELRMKCIEIIELWATGKFVIHICHSIVQGTHSNVITL